MPNAIHIVQPRTVLIPPTLAAWSPAETPADPPPPVSVGVPMLTHMVPSEATALPTASRTASAIFVIASPIVEATNSLALH